MLAHRLRRGRGPAVLIDRTAGTIIGNMTTGGGAAVAFDGVTVQTSGAQCGTEGNAGWIGKTLVKPTAIDRVIIYGTSNHGYVAGANPSITINLRGKQGIPPVGKTNGTLLGTTGSFTDGSSTNPLIIECTNKDTLWDHVFLDFVQNSNDKSILAEMQIWGWQR